jgi:hypothetical protein
MQLTYSDGRVIGEIIELSPAKTIGHAPVEFKCEISAAGAAVLVAAPASFYRATAGDDRFTLTVDSVEGVTLSGTIRRR